MENAAWFPSDRPAGFGPRLGGTPRPLSPARAAILAKLRDQPDPTTQAAIVSATGLHGNTVREHLDGLVRRGLVRRTRALPSGRGRPAWLYEMVAEEPQRSEYAGLASALAVSIAKHSPDPQRDAAEAGEAWGRQLAGDRGAAPVAPEAARQQVVDLLDDLGFDPETQDEQPENVRLTRCPLLEAAHRQPDVVCSVHLGLVRGVLAEYGANAEGSALLPFAEPGACRLVVPPVPPAAPDPVSPGTVSA
ncbi:helix-turn-helix transcriptional regulator [Nocardioides pacificus]